MQAKKIIFPTDFSRFCEEGLAYATSLARDTGGKLLIVHVESAGETYEAPYYGDSEERRRTLQQQLKETVPADETVPYEHWYLKGVPAKAIVKLAKDEGVDLIVMPTHGRKGLSHLLMGSVAEAVVRRAPCPVMTFRPASLKPAHTGADARARHSVG